MWSINACLKEKTSSVTFPICQISVLMPSNRYLSQLRNVETKLTKLTKGKSRKNPCKKAFCKKRDLRDRTSIGTGSRIYCNPSGVEYSRKILKVQTAAGVFRVLGSWSSTELRGEPCLSLRGIEVLARPAILLELSCKVCRNEPALRPLCKAVRLRPVYRKSRERLFNWTRSTIIEERCNAREKRWLAIPLLAALLILRPSDRGIFNQEVFAPRRNSFC